MLLKVSSYQYYFFRRLNISRPQKCNIPDKIHENVEFS